MIRSELKAVVPDWVLRGIERARIGRLRRRFGGLSRAQAFCAIYREGCWGRREEDGFCSGSGSVGPLAESYCGVIEKYAKAHHIDSIADLGCGDFKIGSRLAALSLRYRGVDIVPELVEHNRRRYESESVTFECVDIIEDPLPAADLCLMRQVLQHLSNGEIQALLPRLAIYPHVIVTEHVPCRPTRFPNLDKPHGPDTRLPDGSGVFLELPPFCCRIDATWEVSCDGSSKLLTVALARKDRCGF